MANTVIKIKHSTVSGNVPSSLAVGELALNAQDGKLYYGNAANVVTQFANNSTGSGSNTFSFATINSNGSLILASSPTDILSLVPGNNITFITNTTSKSITINSSASSSGGSNTSSGISLGQVIATAAGFNLQ